MSFNKWLILQENNLQNLYASTVQAFPLTTKRQHVIDPIQITELTWVPYLGLNTLFVKALAESGENEYNPMILFKRVAYHPNKDSQNWVEIVASDGRNYIFEKLQQNEVSVRCNCPDFLWRFNYHDYLDQSLYGRVRRKYEANTNPGSANPLEMPGLCKHLIKLAFSLNQAGILGG